MKVLKFGAVWCPGCITMKPRWQQLEAEYPWLETQYYEYDESKEEAEKYGVTKELPVFIFLDKRGGEFLRLSGEVDKNKLMDVILENKDR